MSRNKARRWRPHRRGNRLPLGLISAMLTACTVTLIGVASGFEPFVILKRALIASLILGLFVSTGANVVRMANFEYTPNHDEADPGTR